MVVCITCAGAIGAALLGGATIYSLQGDIFLAVATTVVMYVAYHQYFKKKQCNGKTCKI